MVIYAVLNLKECNVEGVRFLARTNPVEVLYLPTPMIGVVVVSSAAEKLRPVVR